MEYHESLPAKFRHLEPPWTIGSQCPNCQQEGREGYLMLLDKGDDLNDPSSIADWAEADAGAANSHDPRFEIVCSEFVDESSHCTFRPFPLKQTSATVPEDYAGP